MKILGLLLVVPFLLLLAGVFVLAVLSAIKDSIDTILYGSSFSRWVLGWTVAALCFSIGLILIFGE